MNRVNDAPPNARTVLLSLKPHGHRVRVAPGTPLRDVLFDQGVEFPCGGRGRCRGCRVRVVAGALPLSADDQRLLSEQEVADGWRLACQASAQSDLEIDLAQWETPILADDTPFGFVPREGFGVAIDLGTTTLAAQLLDLKTGQILAVRTALNAQARHGADIMSRIDAAMQRGGHGELVRLIREQIGGMVVGLVNAAGIPGEWLKDVVVVGNTAMHHLFSGLDLTPLAMHPFEPESTEAQLFGADELGWTEGVEGAGSPTLPAGLRVLFLPVLGGFVGSDLLAGVLATRMHENSALQVLIDLGTNGEIVVGNRTRLLAASTAAGPAFEAARIARGMRAATGAISEVWVRERGIDCRVIGGGTPRGICGSGLVDAVACALDLGWIQPNGRLAEGTEWMIRPPVALQQADIRELQLAKGAIAAGLNLLLKQWGATLQDVTQVWLAGAFGNSIQRTSAQRIGLLPFPIERVKPVGNTALLGAKLGLFQLPVERGEYRALRDITRHVSLNDDPEFLDTFVDAMSFPDA